jgi:hypothetical protein
MLLLTCVRGGRPDETTRKINEIVQYPLNWEEILASSFWQGIASLAYYHLKNIQGRSPVPANVMDQLKGAYYANTAKNTYLYKELSAIIDAFNENSVDLIVLKGMALAKTVYSDIGLRQIGDIDLLVKREYLSGAEKTMSDLGYIVDEKRPLEWIKENSHHICFIHPGKNIKVEIHWHITYKAHPVSNFTYDSSFINRCWERAQKTEIFGKEIRTLGPEDLLIHLSLHFMKHRFLSPEWGYKRCFISKGALIQLYDIALVLKHYCKNINWERFHHEIKEYKSDHMVYATLFLVKDIMGESPGLQDKLNSLIPVKFDPDIMNIMINRIFIREDSFPGVNRFLTQSFGENTVKNGILKILKVMFPAPEVMAARYSVPVSSRKIYLCYAIRPFDVLFRHRKIMTDIPRIRDEAILDRWVYSQVLMINKK